MWIHAERPYLECPQCKRAEGIGLLCFGRTQPCPVKALEVVKHDQQDEPGTLRKATTKERML